MTKRTGWTAADVEAPQAKQSGAFKPAKPNRKKQAKPPIAADVLSVQTGGQYLAERTVVGAWTALQAGIKRKLPKLHIAERRKHFEQSVVALFAAYDLPTPVFEHRFCKRLWRLDVYLPDVKLAIEIDGGVWTSGGHSGGKGQAGDFDKTNTALLNFGIATIRTLPPDEKSARRATLMVFGTHSFMSHLQRYCNERKPH